MAKTSSIEKSKQKPKFPVRAHNRCRVCGRPRGFLRKFAMCRICFRGKRAPRLHPRHHESIVVSMINETYLTTTVPAAEAPRVALALCDGPEGHH